MASGTWGGATDVHPMQVRISFLLGVSLCQTGFKLRDQSLAPANPQDAATEVASWVTASFRTLFHIDDQFLGVDVTDLSNGAGGSFSFANTRGTADVEQFKKLPTYVQVPVSQKSSLRRRYGQGRMLFPVRLEDSVTGDLLNAAGIAAYQGVITELTTRYLSDAATNRYRMITAHGVIPAKPATPTRPARPEVPASWYDVTTLRLGTVMSFVRSRKQGVGS